MAPNFTLCFQVVPSPCLQATFFSPIQLLRRWQHALVWLSQGFHFGVFPNWIAFEILNVTFLAVFGENLCILKHSFCQNLCQVQITSPKFPKVKVEFFLRLLHPSKSLRSKVKFHFLGRLLISYNLQVFFRQQFSFSYQRICFSCCVWIFLIVFLGLYLAKILNVLFCCFKQKFR